MDQDQETTETPASPGWWNFNLRQWFVERYGTQENLEFVLGEEATQTVRERIAQFVWERYSGLVALGGLTVFGTGFVAGRLTGTTQQTPSPPSTKRNRKQSRIK